MESFRGFCKRLSRNRLAVAGALIFASVLALAAIAPWISRYQPEAMSLASDLNRPAKITCSALMRWGAMCSLEYLRC